MSMCDKEKLAAIRKYRFWGGDPFVIESRRAFEARSTAQDRSAIAKLSEAEFNALGWEPILRMKLRAGYVRPSGNTVQWQKSTPKNLD